MKTFGQRSLRLFLLGILLLSSCVNDEDAPQPSIPTAKSTFNKVSFRLTLNGIVDSVLHSSNVGGSFRMDTSTRSINFTFDLPLHDGNNITASRLDTTGENRRVYGIHNEELVCLIDPTTHSLSASFKDLYDTTNYDSSFSVDSVLNLRISSLPYDSTSNEVFVILSGESVMNVLNIETWRRESTGRMRSTRSWITNVVSSPEDRLEIRLVKN